MKPSLIAQFVVLVGLLLAASFCLTSHPASQFSDQKAPELYAAGVKKLEGTSAFEGKDSLVVVLKSLVDANSSSLDANASQARFIHETGFFLLVLASIQVVSIWLSFKRTP